MRNIILMLSITMLCASVFASNGILSAGNGIEASPWLIRNIDDFHHFCSNSDYWDDYVRLECDLDLSADGVYTRAPIAPSRYINPYEDPAWHEGVPFTGFFDGNHRTISNLTVLETFNAPGENVFECTALFGRIRGGTVINLYLDSADITGPDYASLLCAWNSGGHIMNCYTTGIATARRTAGLCAVNEGNVTSCHSTTDVTGTSNVGGLCGQNIEGIITNCSSIGSVWGSSSDVGGLVGDNQRGVVMNSFSDSKVSARRYAGGLCGSNSGHIENCYATGEVKSEDDIAGGLCASNTGKIKNSYAIGSVSGADYNKGLCGRNNYFGTIVGCYWDTQTSGLITSAGGQSKTTGQMQMAETFEGWNHGDWTIDQGTDYPRLSWQHPSGVPITTDYPAASYTGDGTAESPFVLLNADDLVCLSRRVPDWDTHFKLANDIDMNGRLYFPPSEFNGSLDGYGYSILNLSIDFQQIGCSYQLGLFGKVTGVVRNLSLDDVYIQGKKFLGALCGCNVGGQISNCSSQGQILVNGIMSYAGGLCGCNLKDGMITDSYSAGQVNGAGMVGGLCGSNQAQINRSYSTAEVTGTRYNIGGLCGENLYSNTTNCYAAGTVTGDDGVGGLCGHQQWADLANCYAVGFVTGVKDVGGLIGDKTAGCVIADSFWDTETSGVNISAGGTGKTTGQMQTVSTFTDAGWDFEGETNNGDENIWWMPVDDYPAFTWAGCPFQMAADVNDDCKVNLIDLSIITDAWLQNCFANPHACQ